MALKLILILSIGIQLFEEIHQLKIFKATFNQSLSNQKKNYNSAYKALYGLFEEIRNVGELYSSNQRSNKKFLQSLTILMNFDFDGTSSFLLKGNDKTFWSESGICKHGQLYDPTIRICRDMFCMEGFVLSVDGCVEDRNFNKSTKDIFQSNLDNEIKVEMYINHKLCDFNRDEFNQIACDQNSIKNVSNLSDLFVNSLADQLDTISDRIGEFTIHSHEFENVTIAKDNDNDNDNDFVINNQSIQKNQNDFSRFDSFLVQFKFKDKNLFPNETIDSITLYYLLNAYSLLETSFIVSNRYFFVTEVVKLKQYGGWCDGNEKHYQDGFRILASFNAEIEYSIHVQSTDKIYRKGNFFLLMIYKTNMSKTYNEFSLISKEVSSRSDTNFKDFTSMILEQNSSSVSAKAFLVVCDRNPKIRIECINHRTIKARICEFNYDNNTQEFCWKHLKKCYNIDEYEFDSEEPQRFIRICDNGIVKSVKDTPYLDETIENSNVSDQIIAILTFGSILLSLFAMASTLITYFLFEELRTIPGWNMINLISALSIGLFSFWLGPFLISLEIFCFLIAILTHYGLLASVFWMNIIAFDLYRNFRQQNVIILLKLNRKERLPFYCLYGWALPFLIILVCVTIDLSVKDSIDNAPYRPCYAGYLEGCLNHKIISNSIFKNDSALNKTDFSCGSKQNISVLSSVKNCWILSGKATLIFFGVPITALILVNAILFFLTIDNIRPIKHQQKNKKLRRFSNLKMPGDDYAKFFIRMGILMGFSWIFGILHSFLTAWSNEIIFQITKQIFGYLFSISTGLIGVNIFLMLVFKIEILDSYKRFFSQKKVFLKNLWNQNIKLGLLSKQNISVKKNNNCSNKSNASLVDSIKSGQDTKDPQINSEKI